MKEEATETEPRRARSRPDKDGDMRPPPDRATGEMLYTLGHSTRSLDELLLLLDLPGVKPEDVEVHFERGELTVKGSRTAPEQTGKRLLTETRPGDFYRAFLLGREIDARGISAEMKNGVLRVHLPRAEAAKPRRVPVQGS